MSDGVVVGIGEGVRVAVATWAERGEAGIAWGAPRVALGFAGAQDMIADNRTIMINTNAHDRMPPRRRRILEIAHTTDMTNLPRFTLNAPPSECKSLVR
ncbi:MAG: hypothetical protein L0Y55_07510 [Anaerolineales bacterium]|nr:hypothetical protein [Anaerolineales bacterium]